MSIAITAHDAESQLSAAAISGLIKDIPIPPRPIVVQHMLLRPSKFRDRQARTSRFHLELC
jgi:hypothetical protein